MAATGGCQGPETIGRAQVPVAGMPAPTMCRLTQHAGCHRLHGWHRQFFLDVGAAMAATGACQGPESIGRAQVPVAGMPAPTMCRLTQHAGCHRLHGWHRQPFLAVGAAMAATGVCQGPETIGRAQVPVAGMPAPTMCRLPQCAGCHRLHGWHRQPFLRCGSCHGSDWGLPRTRNYRQGTGACRRHAGSHNMPAATACRLPRHPGSRTAPFHPPRRIS